MDSENVHLILITSAKDVRFLPAFVCGFVDLFVKKVRFEMIEGIAS